MVSVMPGIERQIRETNEGNARIGRERLGDSFLGQMGMGEQVLDDGFRSGKRVPCRADIIGAHHAGFGEQFCEIIFVGKHRAWSPWKWF